MTTKVTKEVMFECAHMLSHYEGACQNLHGHSYKVQVSVKAPVRDPAHCEAPDCYMVLDFSDLKKIINDTIMQCDHAVLFSAPEYRSEAEESLYEWAVGFNKRYVELPGRTTCEFMASYFRDLIMAALTQQMIHFESVGVKLWETATSAATSCPEV